MPNLANAKKALRQNVARRARNDKKRDEISTLRRKIRKLLEAKDAKGAAALLPVLQKQMDKAVKAGVLTKNTASRALSRVTVSVNKIA